ncbi:amidohydrolase family protein [Pseudoalteromonas sp. JBTF-M23]|uniref:Amidohydrolase family protein n=1 Tax=Pseudoalteromonas caenipelagi TaxID=2726988 RepID=A0A849VGB0_9GAMM|nr:amidohydrolase family protein [Pseudoalteromonas caenipelagi]NOU50914.1 amidohydrolase family protein [Pseudoalteromonas caenipelagi]
MAGIPQASACFSLNHIFFDGLLDKLSELSFCSAYASHQYPANDFDSIVFYGKIYCQFEPLIEVVDAMVVREGKIELLGSVQDANDYIAKYDLKVRVQYLDERQSICPGFVEPSIHLVMSAVLQQWNHLGPFGFDCSWQKIMPNYSVSYIARAIQYLDKGLDPHYWLLGYGLYSGLLGYSSNENRREVYALIKQLNVQRPIAILDASSAIAYVNDATLDLVYDYLLSSGACPFSCKTALKERVDNQYGLQDEQLLWLVGALPTSQLQSYLDNIFSNIDKIIDTAIRQGITHLGVIDTHPFARKVLSEYQRAVRNINLIEPKNSWLREINSLTCLNQESSMTSHAPERSLVINIGDVGYCGYEWVQSYHGQSLLQPCQQLISEGYNVCLQSGFPAQPINPMRAAEQASTRVMEYAPGCYTRHERVLLPEQCLSKSQSLHAITHAGAMHLGVEAGRLEVGNQANFVHLSDDPLDTNNSLRDVAVINCYSNAVS